VSDSHAPFLTRCAWCLRIRVDERWLGELQAFRELRTSEWPAPPLFTHGICPDCLAPYLAELETRGAEPAPHAA
jgi:hypothetical protein